MFFDSFFFGGGFDILFFLVFFIIIGMFVMMFIRGIGEWNRNNQSPRLTVEARIVSKRTNVSHHTQHNAGDATGAHGMHSTSSTSYYVTFEVESGDRMELRLSGGDYGMLAEGDVGHLTFQGTRYLGFNRQ